MAVAAYEKRDFDHARTLWVKQKVVLGCTNHGTQRFFKALSPQSDDDPELKTILERFRRDMVRAKGKGGIHSVLSENCTLALRKQL